MTDISELVGKTLIGCTERISGYLSQSKLEVILETEDGSRYSFYYECGEHESASIDFDDESDEDERYYMFDSPILSIEEADELEYEEEEFRRFQYALHDYYTFTTKRGSTKVTWTVRSKEYLNSAPIYFVKL